jgi:hypothetical protein
MNEIEGKLLKTTTTYKKGGKHGGASQKNETTKT